VNELLQGRDSWGAVHYLMLHQRPDTILTEVDRRCRPPRDQEEVVEADVRESPNWYVEVWRLDRALLFIMFDVESEAVGKHES